MAEAFKRAVIRGILTAAGTPEENIENAVSEIFKPHIAVTDGLQNKIEELEAKANAADKLKTELASARAKLAELEEADYKAKYEAEKANGEKIKAEYENYKTETAAKATRASKETAYKELMKDANIPEWHWDKIIKYSDIDGIELENGKIKNAKERLDMLKEEWKECVPEDTMKGTQTPTPPAGGGQKKQMTVEEILAITDSKERLAKINEYKELFQQQKG